MHRKLLALVILPLLPLAAACGTLGNNASVAYTSRSEMTTDSLLPIATAATKSDGYRIAAIDELHGAFVAARPDNTMPLLVEIDHPKLSRAGSTGTLLCDSGNTCTARVVVTPLEVVGNTLVKASVAADAEEKSAQQLLATIIGKTFAR
jgi:hypothetical protein